MINRVHSAAYMGIHAYEVDIEVDVANGLPQFQVVGLPDTSVKESKERVRSAIKNSGYPFPPDKITVNLAPADIKKEGSAYDLPIALGILAASDILVPEDLANYVFMGELALDGSLRGTKGVLVIANGLKGKRRFVLPQKNAGEAALEENATVYPARSLKEVVDFLKKDIAISPLSRSINKDSSDHPKYDVDFSEIKGQEIAKRAIEIAVAGGHNILLIGPPGSGKTMLAKRLPTIHPPLSFDEAMEVTKIHSAAGHFHENFFLVRERPFRAPHHTISSVALTGGGSWPTPGEVSLSHHGVLFLDEFPGYRRDVLESLRGPLEDGEILISRAKMQMTYPATFMLAAALNPCPCGFLTDRRKACRCSLAQIQKYRSKISGPILDRIDLHIEVPALAYETFASDLPSDSSASIRERVVLCRQLQADRLRARRSPLNARMGPRDLKKFAVPSREGRQIIESVIKELRFSARGYYKILKVARTIADLAGSEMIGAEHIAEAVQYRCLDRQW